MFCAHFKPWAHSVVATHCSNLLWLKNTGALQTQQIVHWQQLFGIQLCFSALGSTTWPLCASRFRPSTSPTSLRQRSARSRRPRRSRPRSRNRDGLLSKSCSRPSSDYLSYLRTPTLCALLMLLVCQCSVYDSGRPESPTGRKSQTCCSTSLWCSRLDTQWKITTYPCLCR